MSFNPIRYFALTLGFFWMPLSETLGGQPSSTWLPVPTYVSEDGEVVVKLRARAHWDVGWLKSDFGDVDLRGSEIRTARIGYDIDFGDKISTRGELAFSGKTLNINEVKAIFKGPIDFIVGQQKIGPSISEVSSGNNEPFMERGHFTDAFFIDRGLGLAFFTGGDRWSFTGGVQKGSLQNGIKNQYLTLTTRATFSPDLENGSLHFGGSLRYREKTSLGDNFVYRQRPHLHFIKTRFVDTGKVAKSDLMMGIEASYQFNSLTIQGEYAQLKAKLESPTIGFDDPTFKGGYIGFDYYLTGETRPYNAKGGNYGGIIPKASVIQGGIGAWQIAARVDYIDLSDKAIFGGHQTSYLLALNWHLNRWFRVVLNYTHSKVKEGQFVNHNGPEGQNKINGFGMRFQFNY